MILTPDEDQAVCIPQTGVWRLGGANTSAPHPLVYPAVRGWVATNFRPRTIPSLGVRSRQLNRGGAGKVISPYSARNTFSYPIHLIAYLHAVLSCAIIVLGRGLLGAASPWVQIRGFTLWGGECREHSQRAAVTAIPPALQAREGWAVRHPPLRLFLERRFHVSAW